MVLRFLPQLGVLNFLRNIRDAKNTAPAFNLIAPLALNLNDRRRSESVFILDAIRAVP
jgi:hypothetical protein